MQDRTENLEQRRRRRRNDAGADDAADAAVDDAEDAEWRADDAVVDDAQDAGNVTSPRGVKIHTVNSALRCTGLRGDFEHSV